MQTISTEDIRGTIEQAFPFEVDKLPLQGPDNLSTPIYGLFRDDNMDYVGEPCRSGYKPHTRDHVVALVEAAQESFNGWGTADIDCYWKDGHYVKVRPGQDAARAAFDLRYPDAGEHEIKRDSDVYVPSLLIRAGYDGKAFKASLMIERAVCRNGLILQTNRGFSESIKHTRSLTLRVADLVDRFRHLLGGVANIAEEIEFAQKRTVKMADFLREVYPMKDDASAAARTRHEARVEAIMARLYRERDQLGTADLHTAYEASAWEAYNAVQGYEQHEGGRLDDTASWMARAVRAGESPRVRKAEQLAFA